jgi:ATP-dependent Clp protease protease subunit
MSGSGTHISPLLKQRMLEIKGYITNELFDKISSDLRYLNAESTTEEIHIYYNSPGGDTEAAFQLYEAIKGSVAPVVSVIDGRCSSHAIIPFLASEKENRYMSKRSYIELHVLRLNNVPLSTITEQYLQQRWEIQKAVNEIILNSTSVPQEKLENIMKSGQVLKLYLQPATNYEFVRGVF